jgi:hypothetical protein
MTTATERWARRPPAPWTVRLLGIAAVVAVVAGVAVGGWVKLVGLPVFLFCGNLAVIAWKARRHAARRLG